MNPLVSVSWLNSQLYNGISKSPTSDREPGLVVLDATLPPVGVVPATDVRARYLARHIPGAVFFDIEEFSDHATNLPHMLPTPEEFARKASALGIGSQMTIVVYEQEGVFSSPRAWWMFRTFGVEHVFLLDGGLKAWTGAGLPTESGPEDYSPAVFHAQYNPTAVRDFQQIQEAIAEGAQILDARSAGRFTGIAPEPRPGLSSGHMPGATSMPFTELLDNGRFLPVEKLCQLFLAKGVALDQPITTTCGSGVTAAAIALGLELAGAKNVSLYDGSWAEYAQRPEAEIQKAE
jgi:thiosulfate/3-mercaptopyruvate sulfurtransferase